jgi:hypothetical protein
VLSVEQTVSEFIGVYDADATLLGEISYWIGARLGTRHCSLCELTHGIFTKKSEWKSCTASLSVPFSAFHRNDAPSDAIAAAAGQYPVVLARIESEIHIVFTPEKLNDFNGDTAEFVAALRSVISGD